MIVTLTWMFGRQRGKAKRVEEVPTIHGMEMVVETFEFEFKSTN